MNRNTLIENAILSAVSTGKAGWIKDILPAVKSVVEIQENGAMEIRNCLGGLLKSKQVFRAAFDPTTDDEYYVTPGTPRAR